LPYLFNYCILEYFIILLSVVCVLISDSLSKELIATGYRRRPNVIVSSLSEAQHVSDCI